MTILTRRRVAAWFGLGLALWAAVCLMSLWETKTHLDRARAKIDEIAGAAEASDTDTALLFDDIRSLDRELVQARNKSNGSVLVPLRVLPVVGRHLDVVRSMSSTAQTISGAGVAMLDAVDAAAGGPASSRLTLLAAAEDHLALIDSTLADPDVGRRGHLIGPLADAQDEFLVEVGEAQPTVSRLLSAVRGLRSFMADSDYLLLGANNSEMRLGSGMVLSIGEIAAVDGEVSLERFESTDDRFPVPMHSPSSPIAIDDDVQARWGFLSPTNDYRKLTYTARFEEYTGPQSLLMWEAQTGHKAKGVLLVDPFVIDAILGVVGPVEVDGEPFGAGQALDYLLKDQYAAYDTDNEAIDERRDQLSVISAAVIERLGEGGFSPQDLISALRPLIAGRHLMMYSSDATEQEAWRALGAAGTLSGEETGVFLLNTGASKLDPYLETAVDVTTEAGPEEGTTTVHLAITVTNTIADPAKLPDYVVGPWEEAGLGERGTYSARLVVYAPALASGLRFEPRRTLEVYGADGQVWVMGSLVEVPPRQDFTVRVSFEVPDDLASLTVEPSARYPYIGWSTSGGSFNDRERFTFPLAQS